MCDQQGSDQQAHMDSLVRAFASCLNILRLLGSSESIHVKTPHCWKSRVAAHILMCPCLAGVHAQNQEFYSGGGDPGPTAGKQSGQRRFLLGFFCFVFL